MARGSVPLLWGQCLTRNAGPPVLGLLVLSVARAWGINQFSGLREVVPFDRRCAGHATNVILVAKPMR